MKIEKLVTLADELDAKGLKEEADKMDTILAELTGKKVEGADGKERETSKKVMKVFKRLNEACQKAAEADVDTRGPYRILFDKARAQASEIAELLKEIEFTPQGEEDAAQSGQIEKNLGDAEEAAEGGAPAASAVGPAAPVTEVELVPVQ